MFANELGRNISIDESLMKFKGQRSYKQYNPSKRARFGIQYYKLCESSTGHVKKISIYTGQDREATNIPVSTSVVMKMLKDVKTTGHNLYIDNWCSSPNLFMDLHNMKFNVVGTVRCNRKDMPTDLKLGILPVGDHRVKSSGSLLAMRWKDEKDVYVNVS